MQPCSSLEPRLSVLDFVAQLWRTDFSPKLWDKIRNGKPGFEASLAVREDLVGLVTQSNDSPAEAQKRRWRSWKRRAKTYRKSCQQQGQRLTRETRRSEGKFIVYTNESITMFTVHKLSLRTECVGKLGTSSVQREHHRIYNVTVRRPHRERCVWHTNALICKHCL